MEAQQMIKLVLKAVLVFLVLFLSISSARAEERIYGQPAQGSWPEFVAFSDSETDLDNRCAGVLIKPRWVLTAPNGCLANRKDSAQAFIGATKSIQRN
jgi:secreted trypsin-like serine protease